MFRSRVFGGAPDGFHLACEYGPANVQGKGNMPTPEALTPMELDWTSAESETQVMERFAQRQSALLLAHTEERVSLQLSWEAMEHAADFPGQHLRVHIATTSAPPVLRSLHFSRTSGSGSATESLLTGLLQHMDLSTVWKLRATEGFPQHFWASCTDAALWASLFNLNMSSCGLVSLPSAVGQLASLHVLRLNHNRLTTLPQELGQLGELEVLSVNHNQLTTLPAELRRCSSLRELHLESNRLVTPLLDLTHATALESLQLYGNPLEYLPELAPAVGLRSLSLANVRILADTAYSRWEVEVTAPSSSYTSMVMGGRGHKLQPLFNLVFRRSSVQHPLLAGAMSKLMEEPSNLELLVREDVALQQLVLASMGTNPLVVQQAVKIMSAVGAYAGAAKRLVRHNVVRAVTGMLASGDKSLQLSGLRVLSSLAAGAAEGELPGEMLVPTSLLDRLLDLIREPATHQEVRCAALHALGNSAFDASNRRRYLQSPGLMQLLVMLAAAPDTPAPVKQRDAPSPPATAATNTSASGISPVGSVQQQQEAEAEGAGAEITVGDAGSAALQHAPGDISPAVAAPAATARSAASSVSPVAPNPHSQPATGEVALSASPPSITMSRAPSTAGNSAAAGDGSSTADQGSDSAALLSPPRKAMAAAASAAAAAAAAGTATTGPASASAATSDAAGQTAAGAVGGPAKKGAAGSAAATPPAPSAAAAAEAILPKRQLVNVNNPVKLQAIRLLGILGQNEQVRIALGQPPIRGRGLRVLAMDGGGMKGMAMVELLRQLERRAGAPIWTLFDVIGGTSTGGLLAVSLGLLRLDLDACQEIYTSLGNKVFNQSSVVQEDAGWRDNLYRMYTTSSANMRVAVYGSKHDAANYEDLLRRFCAVTELGCASDRLIDTAVMGGPKVFVVATLASVRPASPFAFRNYELPDEATPIAEQLAACAGSCKHHVWEAVRASSAAPYYLDDFLTADGKRFQDGATTANNPTVIALQQARLLHPQLPVDCVVSLGCGGEPRIERSKGLSAVIDTGAVLLESACSTDRVHEALATTLQLVPGCQYFRFNAEDARCAMELDDIRPESWSRLMSATSDYCSQPQVAAQFDRLAALLKQGTPATAADAASAAAEQQAHASSGRNVVKGLAPKAGWPTQLDSTGPQGQLQTQQQQHQQQQQHYQQLQLQHQTGQLLLGRSLLGNLAGSSTSQQHTQHQQQQAGGMSEGLEPAVAAALQKAAADGSPASAPRLLYQRDVLLVQAPRQVAAAAAAAAAAQGVNLSALQQQEHVAQLLAAALPPNLLHVCDLQEAAASAAVGPLSTHGKHTTFTSGAATKQQQQQHSPHHLQQQHAQHQQSRQHALQLADVSTSAKASQGGAPHSADPSPRHLAATRHASIGNSHQHSSSTAAALAATALGRSGQLQRQSDTGLTSLASPKPASWLEYIFPWQGSSSANSSPRHAQLTGADVKQAGSTAAAAGDSAAAAGASGAAGLGRSVQLPSGAWASSAVGTDSILGSPARELGHLSQSRPGVEARTAGTMPAVQSSPDPLPVVSTNRHQHSHQQLQQQPEAVSPSGASLAKIRSLPAHYHSLQQAHLASEGGLRSTSHSPVLTSTHMGSAAAPGASTHRSIPTATAGAAQGATGASTASNTGHQQQHVQGGPAVAEVLQQQLLRAAGRVGVVHLALHATDAGLVAGWQQQLAAVIEPGPEADQLLDFLSGPVSTNGTNNSTGSSSSRLSQLVGTQGPVLLGPQGALVAVLAQQQVLAPVSGASKQPAAASTHSSAGLTHQAGSCKAGLRQQAVMKGSAMQFVTSWLLQLTLPDSSRMLGVSEVWPLLSQLQQLIVVSSSCLPKPLVHVLLRGGAAAVVCGTEPAEVDALDAADVAEFFRVFYAEGLWQGLDVVEALRVAVAAVPTVGDSAYECYQLM